MFSYLTVQVHITFYIPMFMGYFCPVSFSDKQFVRVCVCVKSFPPNILLGICLDISILQSNSGTKTLLYGITLILVNGKV